MDEGPLDTSAADSANDAIASPILFNRRERVLREHLEFLYEHYERLRIISQGGRRGGGYTVSEGVKISDLKYPEPWRNHVVHGFGVVAAFAAIVTIAALLMDPPTRSAPKLAPNQPVKNGKPTWALVALVLWTVVPPIYFWFEH